MKLNHHLKDWKQIISQRFPHLSLPQVSGLATWSFGMVMAQSSSLTRVSNLIAKINQEQENTVRQRLQEWYKEGKAKAKKNNKKTIKEYLWKSKTVLLHCSYGLSIYYLKQLKTCPWHWMLPALVKTLRFFRLTFYIEVVAFPCSLYRYELVRTNYLLQN
jgi:hypothetical protein